MPEDIALISSKSGVDQCRDGRVNILTRKECRQTDGFSALYNRYTYMQTHMYVHTACTHTYVHIYISILYVRNSKICPNENISDCIWEMVVYVIISMLQLKLHSLYKLCC